MRPLFLVGLKLIGVLVLYWALQHITPLLASVRLLWAALPPGATDFDPVWNLVAVLISLVAALSFAGLLLFRTEVVAAIVPMPAAPTCSRLPEPKLLLHVGILMSGLLVACTAVPKVVLEAFALVSSRSSIDVARLYTAYGEVRLAESIIQLGMAWVLVFRSAWVARVIGTSEIASASIAGDAGPAGAAGAG